MPHVASEPGRISFAFRDVGESSQRVKRYIYLVARELGIAIGGWHDFRHTLNTKLRKLGWSARVRADILGHSTLQMAEQVYDHADGEDFLTALGEIEGELLRDVTNLH